MTNVLNKRIPMMFMILLAAALLVGCSGKKDRTKDIISTGVLRVAINDGYSNLAVKKEDGTYEGLEPKLAAAIAEAYSLNIQYVPVNEGENAVDKLAAGEADIALGSIVTSADLEKEYSVSDSYASAHAILVTRRGDFTSAVSEIGDGKVGISEKLNSDLLVQLTSIESDNKSTYTSWKTAAEALLSGTIKYYFCYETEAVEILNSGGFQAQNVMDMEKENYVMLTNAANKELAEGIDVISQYYLANLSK